MQLTPEISRTDQLVLLTSFAYSIVARTKAEQSGSTDQIWQPTNIVWRDLKNNVDSGYKASVRNDHE